MIRAQVLKERTRGFITGVVATTITTAVLMMGATAFANALAVEREITVTSGHITIVADGHTLNLQDAQGNPVEPFIYEGTTFVPVRSVAEMFGVTPSWDGYTSTVYLNSNMSTVQTIPTPPATPPAQDSSVQDDLLNNIIIPDLPTGSQYQPVDAPPVIEPAPAPPAYVPAAPVQPTEPTEPAYVPTEPTEPTEPIAEETPANNEPSTTVSQQNAMRSAQDYISLMGFSRTGLIAQLEFEGFSTADATHAVDNINVNWYEQAARSAQAYQTIMGFSRSSMINQLVFDGFTQSQAEHGATAVGL